MLHQAVNAVTVFTAALYVLKRLFGKGKQRRRQAGSEDEQKLFYRETDDVEG